MKIIYTLIFLTVFTHLSAQNFQTITVAEQKQQSIVNEPLTLPKGFFRAQVDFEPRITTLTLYNAKGKRVPPSFNVSANLFFLTPAFRYGITKRCEIGLYLPYVHGKSLMQVDFAGGNTFLYNRNIKLAKGFLDLKVLTKFLLLKETKIYPAMAAYMYVTFPTGSKKEKQISPTVTKDAISYGYYTFRYGMIASKRWSQYRLMADISCLNSLLTMKSVYLPNIPYKGANRFSAIITQSFMVNSWLSVGNITGYEYEWHEVIDDLVQKEKPVELLSGILIYYQFQRIRLTQTLGIPIYIKSSNAATFFSISLNYTF